MSRSKRLFISVATVFSIPLSGYTLYVNNHVSSTAAATDGATCDMPSMQKSAPGTRASTVAARTIQQQSPGQPAQPSKPPEQDNSFDDFVPSSPAQEQEDNKRCERPNPNGQNPDRGGVDPNKIGCKCVRTCANGKAVENPTCKRHCKPNHCDCPDPCKT